MCRLITIVVLHFLITYAHAEKSDTIRESRSLSADSIHLILKSLITNSFGNLESLITFMKTQIRDVVIDLGIQAFKYLKAILRACKIRVFKKLGRYTISDVFHMIFDGVLEFVNEDGYEVIQEQQQQENDEVAETSNFEPEYVLPNPYLLEKLILSGDQ